MLKWLMRKGLAAFERKWNYDASYVHELIDADPLAAWMFSRAAAIGKYRKDVPLAALDGGGHHRRPARGLRPVHAARRLDGREVGRRSEGAARDTDRGRRGDAG